MVYIKRNYFIDITWNLNKNYGCIMKKHNYNVTIGLIDLTSRNDPLWKYLENVFHVTEVFKNYQADKAESCNICTFFSNSSNILLCW